MVPTINAVCQRHIFHSAIRNGPIYIHRILILIDLFLEQRKGVLPTNTRTEASPFGVRLAGNESGRPLLVRLIVNTKVALAPTVQFPTAGQNQIFPRRDIDIRNWFVELDLHRLIDARTTTALVDVEVERRMIPGNAELATIATASSENSPILKEEERVMLPARNLDDP